MQIKFLKSEQNIKKNYLKALEIDQKKVEAGGETILERWMEIVEICEVVDFYLRATPNPWAAPAEESHSLTGLKETQGQ